MWKEKAKIILKTIIQRLDSDPPDLEVASQLANNLLASLPRVGRVFGRVPEYGPTPMMDTTLAEVTLAVEKLVAVLRERNRERALSVAEEALRCLPHG
jgi:hypothetical protein